MEDRAIFDAMAQRSALVGAPLPSTALVSAIQDRHLRHAFSTLSLNMSIPIAFSWVSHSACVLDRM